MFLANSYNNKSHNNNNDYNLNLWTKSAVIMATIVTLMDCVCTAHGHHSSLKNYLIAQMNDDKLMASKWPHLNDNNNNNYNNEMTVIINSDFGNVISINNNNNNNLINTNESNIVLFDNNKTIRLIRRNDKHIAFKQQKHAHHEQHQQQQQSNNVNTNNNNNNNNEQYFSYNIQIIWSIIFGTMITVGILANLLVLATIGSHKSLHTVTNCFLLNLTVSDLVTLLFNAIFNFVFMITGNWPFGNRYCIFNNFITNLTIAISVFTIMVTSKERYNAIVHPLAKRMTKSRALIYILIIWIASAVFAVPALIFSRTLRDSLLQRTVCLMVWPDGYPGKSKFDFYYNLLFLVLTYLLPLMTMAIAYTLMARVLWGSKQIGETTQAQASLVRSKQKVVRMLICVVIVFAVCWLPYHVYFLTTYQWPELTTARGIQHIFLAIYWLAMFNSVLNPIVLLLMNKRFRRYSTKFLNFWPINRAFNTDAISTQTTTAIVQSNQNGGVGAQQQQQRQTNLVMVKSHPSPNFNRTSTKLLAHNDNDANNNGSNNGIHLNRENDCKSAAINDVSSLLTVGRSTNEYYSHLVVPD